MGGLEEAYLRAKDRERARNLRPHIPKVIELAEKYALPGGFLRYVLANYGNFYKFEGEGDSYVDGLFNTVHLNTDDFSLLQNLSPEDFDQEGGALDTFYHEMSHAYIDLLGEDSHSPIHKLIEDAEEYYDDAKLKNGETVTYEYRVIQEAAGMYVGHRVFTYWNALQALHWLRDFYAKGQDPRLTIPKSSWASLSAIEKTYNQQMGRRVFGYESGMFSGQVFVTKPIFPPLKAFCDAGILQYMFRDNFADQVEATPVMKKVVDEINTQYNIWFTDHSAQTNRVMI